MQGPARRVGGWGCTTMRMSAVAKWRPSSERGASMGSSQSCALLGAIVERRRRSLASSCGGLRLADVKRLTLGRLNQAHHQHGGRLVHRQVHLRAGGLLWQPCLAGRLRCRLAQLGQLPDWAPALQAIFMAG